MRLNLSTLAVTLVSQYSSTRQAIGALEAEEFDCM